MIKINGRLGWEINEKTGKCFLLEDVAKVEFLSFLFVYMNNLKGFISTWNAEKCR